VGCKPLSWPTTRPSLFCATIRSHMAVESTAFYLALHAAPSDMVA
jgi:hypothetical protein